MSHTSCIGMYNMRLGLNCCSEKLFIVQVSFLSNAFISTQKSLLKKIWPQPWRNKRGKSHNLDTQCNFRNDSFLRASTHFCKWVLDIFRRSCKSHHRKTCKNKEKLKATFKKSLKLIWKRAKPLFNSTKACGRITSMHLCLKYS